ncbi:MAG: gamma-glutamyl-gamma-aminobutyrate hydrolase family protein [Solirubrobacterales bacterium]|jgi:putative glutamine amidotransferase
MRPTIGVTVGYDDRRADFFVLRRDYIRSVEQAGGLPIILAPGRPDDASDLLDRIHGLVLSGGSDVDPALYGEAPHPKLGKVFRERDDFELALVREALARDMPLLAICRGHQVLNVALGGTLIQDIPSEVTGGLEHDPRRERWERAHPVEIHEGTRLRDILKRGAVSVNSFHHQAIERLGDGLVVSARSCDDQLIEGVELAGRRFVLGVQWHPEAFWNREDGFQDLFEALVSTSRP